MSHFFTAKNISLASLEGLIIDSINLEINQQQSIVITGASGSGKSTLGRLIAGFILPTSGQIICSETVKRLMVNQQDNFVSLSGRRSTYYGQRYENTWMDNSPYISEYLHTIAQKTIGEQTPEVVTEIMALFDIAHLNDRRIMQLSNGERKRTQLAAAYIQQPNILVLDQPFVGLDVASQAHLTELLNNLMKDGLSLVMICSPEEIPSQVSTVIELDKGKIVSTSSTESYTPSIPDELLSSSLDSALIKKVYQTESTFEYAVKMKNVTVTINNKAILKAIDWEVKRGEQWALLGHNGAGKTTILSLITADNPQGYTNDLQLFDKKRGSGESIWDIKKRIGYLSPELHLYFMRGDGIFNTIPGLATQSKKGDSSLSCIDVILSGYRDEIGFVTSASDLEISAAKSWLSFLQLSHLAKRQFNHTSLGEQRSLLLARALVKSPDLIILDEPCQGMDSRQTKRFTHLLDQLSEVLTTTLIYVTHHKNEIPKSVTRIMQLQNGERVQ